MRKMKKIAAMLLALAMVLGMSMTTMAATLVNSEPSNEDKGTIQIQGIDGAQKVTLYKVAKADYEGDGLGMIGYTWATGVKFTFNSVTNRYEPKAEEITDVANCLVEGKITPFETFETDVQTNVPAIYSKEVAVGAYIAIITGASDGAVYNPIFLTVSYNEDGTITEGSVKLPVNYTYGTTSVAKKTYADINKEIIGGTVIDGEKHTAGVGSKVDFQIKPTMPSYPQNAKNKTFFVADTMSPGLTFDFTTLNVKVNGTTLTKEYVKIKDKDDETVVYDVVNYKSGEKVVAVAYNTSNGFNLNFDYETLIYGNGAVYAPVITYSAIVNENAVVGKGADDAELPGNPNYADLYYTNTPNKGEDWDTPINKPDRAEGIVHKEDHEIVYTYQLSFHKTGEGKDANGLKGAVFGIYDSKGRLIDKVTTNANGYAVSTNVKKGTYTVKELVAPAGYSLNTNEYTITAEWATATIKDTATVTNSQYTTEVGEAIDTTQVGWIVKDRFYEMDVYAKDSGASPAYLKSTTTTTTSTSTMTTNAAGGGTVKLEDSIPNTRLVELPSTGGIGTTIFTVAGCGIMIAAAYLFFANRRKEEA